jgi:anti-sigma-K factor RskA
MKLADDPDLIAGEYVLGTLEAGERTAAEEFAAKEPSFAAAVLAWERRFAPLNDLIAAAEPPPGVWPRVAAALDEAVQPERGRQAAFMTRVAELSRVYGANVADFLVQSRRRWRAAAMVGFAVAIALAAILINQAQKPPARPAPQAAAPARPAERFVGALRYASAAPAFLLLFDAGERTLTVRPINVTAPANMHHELWLVPAEGDPVALGPVAGPKVVRAEALSRLSRDDLKRTSFAVSVEPGEGAVTKPSSIVFSGKLEID